MDADHACDDCRKHDLNHNKIGQEKLTDNDIIFRDASFLQEKSEENPYEKTDRQLKGSFCMKRLKHESFLLWTSPLSPQLIPSPPQVLAGKERREVNGLAEDQKISMAVTMPPIKKQKAAMQLLTASWSVPLIPWPLVQPPAQRAPNPRMIPPMRETSHLVTGVFPKASPHFAGTQT